MHNPPLVLVVDDDAQFRDLYESQFGLSGFGFAGAANGAEGLSAAKKLKPDLILLDVLMPVMDGTQALLELKADPETKDIPVLILTNLENRPGDQEIAKYAGAEEFISKDMAPHDVAEKIAAALRTRR